MDITPMNKTGSGAGWFESSGRRGAWACGFAATETAKSGNKCTLGILARL
jgi:hypothetical protein